MATLEDVKTSEIAALKEADLHNAGIQERYRRFREAEEPSLATYHPYRDPRPSS